VNSTALISFDRLALSFLPATARKMNCTQRNRSTQLGHP